MLRRFAAALLALLMSVACAEPLIADACDGDAPTDVAAAVLPHVDGRTVVAGALDLAAADAPVGHEGTDGAPGHAVHVCHCTHAHGGALTDQYAIRVSTRLVAAAIGWHPDRLPPSPSLEPHLRPPVLPHAA